MSIEIERCASINKQMSLQTDVKKRKFQCTRFLRPLVCHKWSGGAHLPLLCAVGHAAAFAVNAALVAGPCPEVIAFKTQFGIIRVLATALCCKQQSIT